MPAPVVYILTEEESAAEVVRQLATRMQVRDRVRVLAHGGKSELEDRLRVRLAAVRYPADARFIVLRDNDGADCKKLKDRLLAEVPVEKRARTRIRIVVNELESWYLGQPDALEACALITAARRREMERARKFRDPDKLNNAKQEFRRLHNRGNQQIALAREIGPRLDPATNRSESFRQFIGALQVLTADT
jgi:hypothetical protein